MTNVILIFDKSANIDTDRPKSSYHYYIFIDNASR